jgi:DNA-binding transcriptional regulator YhcF (GntR family)
VRLRLDRNREESVLDQARSQVISALHSGLLKSGDRLPSLRQVARLSHLNIKTVMHVYARLEHEGWLTIRRGSGAFVTSVDSPGCEPVQAVVLARFLRRHIEEAAGMNLAPDSYAALVQRFVTRSALKHRSVAVLECNREQVCLYTSEIERRVGVDARPVLVQDLHKRTAAALLRSSSLLAVTDFHLRECTEAAKRFQKPLIRLRLQPEFLPVLMRAARDGRVVMLVSDTSFFPAFRRALGVLGLEPEALDRIVATTGADPQTLRDEVSQAQSVYVSPLCDRSVRRLIPAGAHLLAFTNHIASESIEELGAWLLLSEGPLQGSRARR